MSESSSALRIGDYVSVQNTDDEWEDLVGILENFCNGDGETLRRDSEKATHAEVRFPLSRSVQHALRLNGVNFFTDYVRVQLRLNNELEMFSLSSLEAVSWDDL